MVLKQRYFLNFGIIITIFIFTIIFGTQIKPCVAFQRQTSINQSINIFLYEPKTITEKTLLMMGELKVEYFRSKGSCGIGSRTTYEILSNTRVKRTP